MNTLKPISGRLFGIFTLAFIFANALASIPVNAAPPAKLPLPIKQVYIPKGFDSNDHIEVVVTGELPNLCYFGPSATAKIDGNLITIDVFAFRSAARNCDAVTVPFLITVSLGVLAEGEYQIVNSRSNLNPLNSKLQVVASIAPTIDNHVYAGVDSVQRVDETSTIRMHGYNPSDCFVLDRVESIFNETNTLTILPIMKKVRDHCPMKMVPFQIEFAVPSNLTDEDLLIHVRSMKGASVNHLFRKSDK